MHQNSTPPIANPSGICMCGCGQMTPIATRTRKERGQYAGFPIMFVPGHRRKSRTVLDCTYCGKSFERRPGRIKKGSRPYCSGECRELDKKRPPIDNGDGTATVVLTHGKTATIDASDIDLVSRFTWYASLSSGETYYAKAHMEDGQNEYLHRLLLGLPDSEVDHRDGNPLNNRRNNLRLATSSQNSANTRGRLGRSLPKGVYLAKTGRFEAKLQVEGLQIFIGVFDSPEAAARAYDKAAILHFGEFAHLNFPKQT